MNFDFLRIRERLSRRFSVKKVESTEALYPTLSPAERIIWWVLIGAVFLTGFIVINSLNNAASVAVPTHGGSLTEGIVGSPRFVNPLLALSDADRDLTALVYSGLLHTTPEGTVIPDLAAKYEISPDGLTYTVTLRENATFHDGAPVTADDVLFTISEANDPTIKSPKRPNWDGVAVEKLDEHTVRFTLRQAYAPFLQNLTLGILPKHLWSESNAEEFALNKYNVEPIGSGPFEVRSVSRDGNGIPTRFELIPFAEYALGEPYLSRLTIKFYGNESDLISAWKSGDIESLSGISFEHLEGLPKNARIEKAPLSRIFAVFLNQNQAPIFAHKEVRRALDAALDKQKLVNEVLGGYGTPLGGPIPPGTAGITAAPPVLVDTEAAKKLLSDAGWVFSSSTALWEKKSTKKGQAPETLTFSLATSNAPELKAAAEELKRQWQIIGVPVDVKLFETGDLQQNVIRPRKYDTLLFGEVVGPELDFFAFWHSSQRNDPGLNVALYTSTAADKLLESGRSLSDRHERLAKYQEFSDLVTADIGAIFAYSPSFIYITPTKLKGLELGSITTPSDRFANAYAWYTEVNNVWRIFDLK